MPAYYFDSIALLKRYLQEQGSAWVRRITAPQTGNELFSAALAGPEMIATLVRRSRNQRWTTTQLAAAIATIRLDLQNLYSVVSLDSPVISSSMDVAQSHGLRGADAVHLAAALWPRDVRLAQGLSPIRFVSADQEQLQAAVGEAVTIENPNLHQQRRLLRCQTGLHFTSAFPSPGLIQDSKSTVILSPSRLIGWRFIGRPLPSTGLPSSP